MKLGKYRHFKGNEYMVIAIAKHSETLEDFVVYENNRYKSHKRHDYRHYKWYHQSRHIQKT